MSYEVVLGKPHEGDHLHKFREVNTFGDHELVTIVCLQRDCYEKGALSRVKYPPGVIGPKLWWLKKDQDQ